MLSERRKADRQQMAAQVEQLLKAEGVEHFREDRSTLFPRRIAIEIKLPRGLGVQVDFDGDSCQPDVYVLCWNIRNSSACLSDAFPLVNQYHFQKATDIAYGFDDLLQKLRWRIAVAKSGVGFSIEREEEYRRKTENGEHPWQRIRKAQEEGRLGALLP